MKANRPSAPVVITCPLRFSETPASGAPVTASTTRPDAEPKQRGTRPKATLTRGETSRTVPPDAVPRTVRGTSVSPPISAGSRTVITDDAPGRTDVGENDAVTPLGSPTADRVTSSVKPLVVSTDTVKVVVSPGRMVCVCGPTWRPKSRVGVTVSEPTADAPAESVIRTPTGYARPTSHRPAQVRSSSIPHGTSATGPLTSP